MRKKIVIGLVIIVLVIGGIGYGIYQSKQPLAVQTVKIEKEDYEEYHYEEGVVESEERIEINNLIGGKIRELFVKEGSVISKGDMILKIDKEDLQYELDILLAQKDSLIAQKKSQGEAFVKTSDIKLQQNLIEIEKSKIDKLEKELERERILFENGASTKIAIEELEEALKQASLQLNIENLRLESLKELPRIGSGQKEYYNNQIEQIDIKIEQIMKRIDQTEIVSPIDGIVTNFSLNIGDYVRQNQILLGIFQPNQYKIESYVLAKEIRNLDIGMNAYIEIENKNTIETVEGRISFIGSEAVNVISPLGLEEKKVKVIIEPQGKLDFIQGEKVDVKFITYQKRNAQVIAKDYIFPWKDGEAIWVIKEGKAKIIQIDKEFDSSSIVVLKDEIDENTKIIKPPYPAKLAEGISVKD